MTSPDSTAVAVIGTGNIAEPYARCLAGYPELRLAGFASTTTAKAEHLADTYGGVGYRDVDALLADPGVDIVVNLTSHAAHFDITRRALRAGRHVHSEKPLAAGPEEAWELVRLATSVDRRLSCAPGNALGEAARTMCAAVADGRLGRVRVVYAEANWGRIESWHPSPAGFYEVGPLVDVGVYPLNLAVVLFGPVRRVHAFGRVVHPDRNASGGPFTVHTPDLAVCLIEFTDGPVLRLTTNFYVPVHSNQRGMELHGDEGSLYLSDWQEFDATVEYAPFAGTRAPLPPDTGPYPGIEWGRAVRQLAAAIRAGTPHPTPAWRAAHLVDVLDAATRSMRAGGPVDVPPPRR